MKETKLIAKAENFTATDFGKMSETTLVPAGYDQP